MFFNLKQSSIYPAVKWSRYLRWSKVLKIIFFAIFVLLGGVFVWGFWLQTYSKSLLKLLLGGAIISLVLSIKFYLQDLFFNLSLKNIEPKHSLDQILSFPQKFNVAQNLSLKVAEIINRSIQFCQKRKLPHVYSPVILHFCLKSNSQLNFIFSRALLDLERIKKEVKSKITYLEQQQFRSNLPTLLDIIKKSAEIALERGGKIITITDLITALSQRDPYFNKHLIETGLKSKDLEILGSWFEYTKSREEQSKKWWRPKNLAKHGSMGREWTFGYTVTLDKYSIDWSKALRKRRGIELTGHQKKLESLERILSRTKINNPLLVGKPGTGRKRIVKALASRAIFGESLDPLNYHRVVELNLNSLLAEVEDPEHLELVLQTIFNEVLSAGNVILVIDNFHRFVGGKARPGVVDISGMIAKYLHLPEFRIIAISTFSGFHKYIKQNPSVLNLFEKIEIPEISSSKALRILQNKAPYFESKYDRFISYPALKSIITYSERYLPEVPFPQKAINLLDEIMVYVNSTPDRVVLPKHVSKVVSERVEIPVGKIRAKERDILLNLEKLIHQRIINQDRAIKEISTALRRARAEMGERNRPMGSFLFLGPTGVGKTETSKALAETYFGSEDRMIRLDMSEFQSKGDVYRLIGSTQQEGILTTKVSEDPFSLVLLDEIEKAHPDILNLFLQVLDEGYITDGLGRKVSFSDTIIISTSNAGYKIILRALKQGTKWDKVKQRLLEYLFEKGIYRPEFINRFDAVVLFKSLTKQNLLDISQLLLERVEKNLEEKNIKFIITESLKERIVDLSYSPVFGAREMKRVIQDKVEDPIAESLLRRKIQRGDNIKVDPKSFKVIKV